MIGRRKLVAGAAGGILLGLTGIMLTRNEASIRFIGRRQTIIALMDTSTERVLIVLGERDDDLLANTLGLTTVGNTRIDLVVATHRILATQAAREHLQMDSIPSFAIQTNESLTPIRGNTSSITAPVSVELGNGSSMHIQLTGAEADHPDFLITIQCRNNLLVLANHTSALRLLSNGKPDLLALPGPAEGFANSMLTPQILVCNTRDGASDIAQIEVFPADPSIVRIGDGRLTVRDDQFSS